MKSTYTVVDEETMADEEVTSYNDNFLTAVGDL